MNTELTSFLGTGWSFPPEFDKIDAGVVLVSDEIDIYQSLNILFNTSLGERVMQTDYGCNLRDYLFETMSVTFLTFLEDHLRRSILLYEPRIDVERLTVVPTELEGTLEITLTYVIRSTNSRQNWVYPFYINEGTNTDQ